MKDVFIAAYDLHSCLGEGISEAVNTLKRGAIEPSKVDLPEGQSRPYYLLRHAPEQNVQNLSTVAWQTRTLHAVQSVTNQLAIKQPSVYLASSSLDIGGIRDAAQMGAPQFDFGHQIAQALKWHAQPVTVNTACTSAFNALGMAIHPLKAGHQYDAMVLGVEMFNDYTLFGFEAMQLLATNAAQPLGKDRQGLVLGEAVAALHLTTQLNTLSAKQQAKAWRILSYANVVNGRNPTGATETALIQACQQALAEAGLETKAIDLIKLQAAGSPLNDAVEIAALHQVFDHVPPCVALKMALGHTLGASGAAETALLLACIDHEIWPQIDYPLDALLNVPLVTQQSPIAHKHAQTIMLITLGFGGGHSVLILQRNQI